MVSFVAAGCGPGSAGTTSSTPPPNYPATPVTSAHSPVKTRYLRTNAYYDPNNMQYAPPNFSAYDATHNQFFVSNPYLNEIDVFDAVNEVQTAQIPLPGAWGIDLSPFDGYLYAGNLVGDFYQINTTSLTVVSRTPAASIGATGYPTVQPFALSNGEFALLGMPGGLAVDGYTGAVVWNPATNTVVSITDTSTCQVRSVFPFAVSGDRSRVLVSSSTGGICSYDPAANTSVYGTIPYSTEVRGIVANPNAQTFYVTTNLNGVVAMNVDTVKPLGQINGAGDSSSNNILSAVVSLDGTTIYLTDVLSVTTASNATTFTFEGWVPSFRIPDAQEFVVLGAINSAGLTIGPLGHGVGFLDTSNVLASQPPALESGSITPNVGQVSGGTSFDLYGVGGPFPSSTALEQLYFGNGTASSPTFVPGNGQTFNAYGLTPPSSLAGAVDITLQTTDGAYGISPEGFSFGPSILEVVTNAATADGGQTGTIVGYGFGQNASGVQVSIGGQSATVTSLLASPPITPYPAPAQAVRFTIPPGNTGSAANVTVTSPTGSTSSAGSFRYIPAVQSFPTTNALQAGIYDSYRDLYYFTSKNQVQVLSRSSGWQSPIILPNTSTSTQLGALSESPNGSFLAVSDPGDTRIYVLNLATPGTAQVFTPVSSPAGLAVTNSGDVYFQAIGGIGLIELNTATSSYTTIQKLLAGSSDDPFSRVLCNSGCSEIFTFIQGKSSIINPSTNTVTPSPATLDLVTGTMPDFAVSSDGSTVDVYAELANSSLQPESLRAYIDWETWFPTEVVGQKLSADGSLLFQPLTDGVDIIGRNTGRLLYRVQVPGTVASVYDALVNADGVDSLGLITTSGVSFIDISSLPFPSNITTPFVASSVGSVSQRH